MELCKDRARDDETTTWCMRSWFMWIAPSGHYVIFVSNLNISKIESIVAKAAQCACESNRSPIIAMPRTVISF